MSWHGSRKSAPQTGHLTSMRRKKCSNFRVFIWMYARSYIGHSAKEVLDDNSSQLSVPGKDCMHMRFQQVDAHKGCGPCSLIRETAPTLHGLDDLASIFPGGVIGAEQTYDGLTGGEKNRLRSLLDHEVADNTRKNYLSQWNRFEAWAERRKVRSRPADPMQVVAYLMERLDEGCSLSTLRASVSAISYMHKRMHDRVECPDPCATYLVRRTLSAMAREVGREQKQAAPLTEAVFKAILGVACEPRVGKGGNLERPDTALRRGSLDIAMIGMMRDGLLRISEASDAVWSDIEGRSDGSGRLLIRRSKNDQEARGFVAYLSEHAMSYLDTIRNGASNTDSVIGLRPNGIAKRIKRVAQQAGLGNGFSGHSCRVGMACDLAGEGIGLPRIMNVGRWSSAEMVAHYTRNEAAGRNAVAEYYSYRLRLS